MTGMRRDSSDVVVVGAGLAGLAAASYVARSGHRVRLVEGSGQAGGRATTTERDGYRFNQGAHALYRGGEAMQVLGELGVVPTGAQPSKRAAMLLDGEMHVAPAGPLSLARTRLLGWRDKAELAKVLGRLPGIDTGRLGERSVAGWLDDHVGRPRVRAVVESVVRLASYTNCPDLLSAQVGLRQVQMALGEGVLYLDRGWSQLVDPLVAGLADSGVEVERRERLTDLPEAPAVIVATGAPEAASNLLGTRFATGPPAQVSSLDLGLSREPPSPAVIGVDAPWYLSTHSIAAGMAPSGRHHLVAMRYLGPYDEPGREPLDQMLDLVGIDRATIDVERYLHRMTACTAIATAGAGGLTGRPPVEVPGRAGTFLAGDWVGNSGHLADAALASARAAALAAMTHLGRRPVSG